MLDRKLMWALFLALTIKYDRAPEQTYFSMVKFIVNKSSTLDMSFWNSVLHRMVMDHRNNLINYSLEILTTQEWITFLVAFQSLHGISKTNETPSISLLGRR